MASLKVAVVVSKKKKKSSKATAVMAATASTIAAASVDSNRIVSLLRENCFAATRQHQSRFFKCRDLIGHTGSIFAMEFSTDGSYIVSGGGDKTVRLWSLCDVDNEETQGTTPVHQMKTKHKKGICCVAISPDNSRIFSSGDFDSKLFVHDART